MDCVRGLLVACMSLVATNCAANPQIPMSADTAHQIKTIAIIPDIGDLIYVESSAPGLDGGHTASRIAVNWNLNARVVDILTNLLKDRYKIVSVKYDAEYLRKNDEAVADDHYADPFSHDVPPSIILKKAVGEEPTGVDAYILVSKFDLPNTAFGMFLAHGMALYAFKPSVFEDWQYGVASDIDFSVVSSDFSLLHAHPLFSSRPSSGFKTAQSLTPADLDWLHKTIDAMLVSDLTAAVANSGLLQ